MDSTSIPETDELRRFREEWRNEVRGRRGDSSRPGPSSSSDIPPTALKTSSEVMIQDEHAPINRRLASRATALEIYTQAVKLEADGNLNAATLLYRKAFRLQEDVDKLYYRVTASAELGTREVSRQIDALSLRPGVHSHNALIVPALASKTLQQVLATFPPLSDVKFERDVEIQPFHIDRIPDELLLHILQFFVFTADTRSVERFARVSRKARTITLEPSLWRSFVELIYVPPQLNVPPIDILPSYKYDYRELYTGQPRIRLDGVYVAACHYVRRGHSEDAWVNITHLITYYRYLRFLPNGVVLSLLSSDATASPQQIIPNLRLDGPHSKGMQLGHWTLEPDAGSVAAIDIGEDAVDTNGPVVLLDGLTEIMLNAGSTNGNQGAATPKYSFRMRLGLRSRPKGRWNKLDILRYESVRMSTDEATPLPLKHERPYWFSKVRSYGSGMN